jgi:dihydroflavonol-4-reductase
MYSSEKAAIYEVNIHGVKKVIAACLRNGIKSIIHFSSIHAHIPMGYNQLMDEHTPYIESEAIAYDFSKSIGEQLMIDARKHGINVCIVNPTAVIGPHDFQPSLSGKMIIDIYTGKLKSVVQGGFDWVDVRDIAIAIETIIEKKCVNEKFILGGYWLELKEIADLICGVKGEKYHGFNTSILLAKIGLPFIALWAKLTNTVPLYNSESIKAIEEGSNLIDHSHATQKIDFNPRPIKETINDSIDWFKQKRMIL